ncbi:hypothetical protein [uncultured Nitrosomonas sp.]|uniref:hypothetical protein n=1 Tax=uncultured Nitrosomonas sp. TaxID=156424 RepID=UPI0025F2A382|nr:hypothetical protein [uncultured Nitrosomonas sp.]
MIKELSFDDDDDGFYSANDSEGGEDMIVNSKIPPSHLAKIIDEFGSNKDDSDDDEFEAIRKDFSDYDDEGDEITLESLGLH